MGNYLFVNSEDPNLFRYFRFGEKWNECFIIEFKLGADHYEQLYWGDNSYNQKSRPAISELISIAFLPDKFDKWKKRDLEIFQKGICIDNIIKQAENEIKKINK